MAQSFKCDQPIYNMQLHETITIADGFYATRVPGGWLYELKAGDNIWNAVFVPFNNEFMKVYLTNNQTP